jgi:hypothetical protein
VRGPRYLTGAVRTANQLVGNQLAIKSIVVRFF